MTSKELRSRRLALNISVGELAFEVRMPIRAVSEIENGRTEVPNAEVFLRTLERLERGYVMTRDTRTSDS
jgi:transcriptional regulator with XRE-family HTH domain